jgi:hypothetical protein
VTVEEGSSLGGFRARPNAPNHCSCDLGAANPGGPVCSPDYGNCGTATLGRQGKSERNTGRASAASAQALVGPSTLAAIGACRVKNDISVPEPIRVAEDGDEEAEGEGGGGGQGSAGEAQAEEEDLTRQIGLSRARVGALRVGVLAPIAWRVAPRHHGPWERFASLLTEGLVDRGVEGHAVATAVLTWRGSHLGSGTSLPC